MRRRGDTGGRYIVGDKSLASLSAAIAYCMDRALREKRDQYVREIGRQGSLWRAEYNDAGYVQGVRA